MLKIFCNLSLLINFNNSKTYQPAAAPDTFFKDWAEVRSRFKSWMIPSLLSR